MVRNPIRSMAFVTMLIAGCFVLTGSSGTPSAPEYESSAFVHLFEWSWSDIAKECEEWLGPKGFTAVQISPPNEHMEGPAWWTRYQPVTYKLVSRSGDEKAFIDMVSRCKKVGVGIYADAVINHIAAGEGVGVAGSKYANRASPIYDASDMHSPTCTVKNYTDKINVQYCDLEGLPDLCTGCEKVQRTIAGYIQHMSDLGIAGFRIDAAKHQDTHELGQVISRTPQHLYRFQEVISGWGEAVTPDEYIQHGQVTEFDYSRRLRSAFLKGGQLQELESFGESWGLIRSDSAVVFIDNHDTQRGEASDFTYKKGKLYELANVFMLAHPYGYPKVMSSYNFNDFADGPPSTPVHSGTEARCGGQPQLKLGTWRSYIASWLRAQIQSFTSATPWVCEHRWLPIANMVAWRKSAGTNSITNFQSFGGNNTIAFCRGAAACIALNRQEHASWHVKLNFVLPAGRYCDVIQSDDTSTCPFVEVSRNGSASLIVPPMSAIALHTGKVMQARETQERAPSDDTVTALGKLIFANPLMASIVFVFCLLTVALLLIGVTRSIFRQRSNSDIEKALLSPQVSGDSNLLFGSALFSQASVQHPGCSADDLLAK